MILAIVGSTSISLKQATTAAVIIRGLILAYPDFEVISGGAVGVDTLVERIAIELGRWKQAYLPKNRRWEPEGYKDRNMLIAENCDVLWALRSVQSTTYGSGWTADYAERQLGKQVHRIPLI